MEIVLSSFWSDCRSIVARLTLCFRSIAVRLNRAISGSWPVKLKHVVSIFFSPDPVLIGLFASTLSATTKLFMSSDMPMPMAVSDVLRMIVSMSACV